jgi:predicted transcriptional regulator
MRDSKEIRKYMIDHDLGVNEIARELNINHACVSRTINGKENSRKVLSLLMKKGCPVEFLALPEDMREAA